MKKLFLILLVSVVVMSAFFAFSPVNAAPGPLVTCGGTGQPRCELIDLFGLIEKAFEYILYIATPIAGLVVVFGGVYMVVSMGKPDLITKGRKMVMWAVIAWALILSSWLIINSILDAIGYTGPRSI